MSDPRFDADGPVGEHGRSAGEGTRRAGRRRSGSFGGGSFGEGGGRGGARGRDRGRGATDAGSQGSRRASGPQWSSRSTGPGSDPAEMADPEAVAKGICLRALTGAAKTRKQLADLLAKKDVPDEVAAAVLDRFTEVGLIDDAAFAAAWVSSRQSGRGLARRALSAELRAKGVDGEVAATALEAVDPQDEWDSARQLVARRLPSMSRLDRVTAERRLVGMLARKGYGGGLAGWVVREALDDRDAELRVADEAADELGTTAGGASVGHVAPDDIVAGGGWSGRRRASAPDDPWAELEARTARPARPAGRAEDVAEVGEAQVRGLGRRSSAQPLGGLEDAGEAPVRGLGRRAGGPVPGWLVDDEP